MIVYDQLCCGRSDHPDDPALLQVERFVAELACVRRVWGLNSIRLYGQSWGGMLAQRGWRDVRWFPAVSI